MRSIREDACHLEKWRNHTKYIFIEAAGIASPAAQGRVAQRIERRCAPIKAKMLQVAGSNPAPSTTPLKTEPVRVRQLRAKVMIMESMTASAVDAMLPDGD